jgi:hypothetical protein
MRRLRSCVLAIAMLVTLGWPSAARAESDILGWLGELSGPGPFKIYGLGVEVHAWCWSEAAAVNDPFLHKWGNCILENADKVRPVTVSFQASRAKTGASQLFKDDPTDSRNIYEDTYSGLLMFRANKLIDAGFGVSAIHFSGDADTANKTSSFGFWRFGLTPARVVLNPLALMSASTERERALRRLIHLQVESVLITGGFSGSDFGNSKTAYKSSAEFQTRLQFLIDIGVVIRAFKP